MGYNSTLQVVAGSLKALGVDYVDLVLIHWPGVSSRPTEDPTKSRQDTWRALEHLHKTGKAKSIGVSNFMPNHLAEIFSIEPTGGDIQHSDGPDGSQPVRIPQ